MECRVEPKRSEALPTPIITGSVSDLAVAKLALMESTRRSSPLPPSPAILVDRLHILIRTHLWAQIVLAMVLGIGVGLALSPSGMALLEPKQSIVVAGWLALPGQVFLALIQMIMLPLVMSSIILGIASSGDADQLRQMGGRIAPYFMASTCVAVAIGASLATWLEPGSYLELPGSASSVFNPAIAPDPSTGASISDRIVQLIPRNPLSAVLDEQMLQVVVLAILLGSALLSIAKKRAQIIVEFTASVQELSMKIVSWAMLLAPLARPSTWMGRRSTRSSRRCS